MEYKVGYKHCDCAVKAGSTYLCNYNGKCQYKVDGIVKKCLLEIKLEEDKHECNNKRN